MLFHAVTSSCFCSVSHRGLNIIYSNSALYSHELCNDNQKFYLRPLVIVHGLGPDTCVLFLGLVLLWSLPSKCKIK